MAWVTRKTRKILAQLKWNYFSETCNDTDAHLTLRITADHLVERWGKSKELPCEAPSTSSAQEMLLHTEHNSLALTPDCEWKMVLAAITLRSRDKASLL